jgi:hypothetical protein
MYTPIYAGAPLVRPGQTTREQRHPAWHVVMSTQLIYLSGEEVNSPETNDKLAACWCLLDYLV